VAEKYLLLMGSFHKMRSQFPTHWARNRKRKSRDR
jgi:hypothetical protein